MLYIIYQFHNSDRNKTKEDNCMRVTGSVATVSYKTPAILYMGDTQYRLYTTNVSRLSIEMFHGRLLDVVQYYY